MKTTREFDAAFRGELVRSTDAGYDDARRVWNGAIDRRPSLIARCRSEQDVAAVVALARETKQPLAVRGGGHSVAGNGVCDGGIVLDLSGMRAVDVDASQRVARAEGGATWADLDAATQAHGLATTGGLISSTGVGGLTLGGGIGWLMRRHGLTCDNLLAANVVTAAGRVVRASDDENAELFWALRGGGGNFGVVTRFEFRLHPVTTVLGGMLLFQASRAPEVLRRYRDIIADAPDELTSLLAFLFAPPAPFIPEPLRGQPVVAIVLCHCGPGEEAQRDVAALRALRPDADLLAPMPYVALQGMLDAGAPRGLQNYFKSAYLSGLSDGAIDRLVAGAAKLPSPMSQIHLHHMGAAVARVAEDATACGNRDAAYAMNIIATFPDAAATAAHVAWARDVAAAAAPFGTGGVYVNFLGDEGGDRVRAAYGPAKFARLSALKAKLDPENLFRLNQNIPPAP
ncbi:MAG: linked oxidase domain protein [Myxococcales bacterium]|nr:linked oxidase domain protein [Myxococcales bacterium]